MEALFFSTNSTFDSFNNFGSRTRQVGAEKQQYFEIILSKLAASTDKIVRSAGFNVGQVETVGARARKKCKSGEVPAV
jgi:hypothetical protein